MGELAAHSRSPVRPQAVLVDVNATGTVVGDSVTDWTRVRVPLPTRPVHCLARPPMRLTVPTRSLSPVVATCSGR